MDSMLADKFDVADMLQREHSVQSHLHEGMLHFTLKLGYAERDCTVEFEKSGAIALMVEVGLFSRPRTYERALEKLSSRSLVGATYCVFGNRLFWNACFIPQRDDETDPDPAYVVAVLLQDAEQDLSISHGVFVELLCGVSEKTVLKHFGFLSSPTLCEMQ